MNGLLNLTQLLFLFGVVLVYHLRVLRADGEARADALAEKQNEFKVLIVDSGNGFVESVQAALMKSGSKVQVTVTPPTEKPEGNFSAIVVSGGVVAAADAPEWIRSFNGNRLIVQDEAAGVYWNQDAGQAAQVVQGLAEGQAVRPQSSKGNTAWTYVVYIFAALFALQLLFMVLALGISLVAGGL